MNAGAGIAIRLAVLCFALLLMSGCSGSITRLSKDFGPDERIKYITTDLSPENEYYIGRAVSAKLFGMYREYRNPALREYISYVLSVVAAASNKPVTFQGYRVVVLDSSEVNAFAAPGGFIFISIGMLRILPDEDALAAVLAHEVAHVEYAHGLQSVSSEKLSKALESLGAFAACLTCGQVAQQSLVIFEALTNDLVETLVQSGYSRDQELEADAGAVNILRKAGYNPYALVTVLEGIKQVEGGQAGGWFSTHPSAADRLGVVGTQLTGTDKKAPSPARSERFKALAATYSRS